MSSQLSLIIPFYNEEENVSAVIAEAHSAVPGAEIIAVDDGSRDRTPALLDAEANLRVIHFPKNLGLIKPVTPTAINKIMPRLASRLEGFNLFNRSII